MKLNNATKYLRSNFIFRTLPAQTFARYPAKLHQALFQHLPNPYCPHHRPLHQQHRPNSTTATSKKDMSDVEAAKKKAAYEAVRAHLKPTARWVGIGSGSTVVHVVDAIRDQLPAEAAARMRFVPTSMQARELILRAGLPLAALDMRAVPKQGDGDGREDGDRAPVLLDVAFDGADEVDDELNLIKGGGGCLWQEKLVACAAREFVCVADYRKKSPGLCTNFKSGIPIEVHPLAAADVVRELRVLGSIEPKVRQGGSAKAGPVVTDNGMWLIDAPFPPLLTQKADGGNGKQWDVETLAAKIKSLLGVVEVGLFCGVDGLQAEKQELGRCGQKPVVVYFGMEDGSVETKKAKSSS